jgi:hypothetical protein
MQFDPIRWPQRAHSIAWLACFAIFLVGIVFGHHRPWLVWLAFALAPTAIGLLYWRSERNAWLPIANWTVPLLVYMSAFVASFESGVFDSSDPIVPTLVFAIGWTWFVAFFVPTPIVRWWYRRVIRQRNPFDDRTSTTGCGSFR